MVPQPIECVFFDCDDSLYRNDWATAAKLNAKFGAYCSEKLGVSPERMMELFRTHGTTLCGLVKEKHIDDASVDDFLAQVHDISLDDIPEDPKMREMLQRVAHKSWVFTAATREHAVRCLKRIGLEDLFGDRIIACSSKEMINKVGYVSKHDPRCFYEAMRIAGVPLERASGCVLLDDSASNIRTANKVGWQSVLVGRLTKTGQPVNCAEADKVVDTLYDLEDVFPELFQPAAGAEGNPEQKFADQKTVDELISKTVQQYSKKRWEANSCDDTPPPRKLRRTATPITLFGA